MDLRFCRPLSRVRFFQTVARPSGSPTTFGGVRARIATTVSERQDARAKRFTAGRSPPTDDPRTAPVRGTASSANWKITAESVYLRRVAPLGSRWSLDARQTTTRSALDAITAINGVPCSPGPRDDYDDGCRVPPLDAVRANYGHRARSTLPSVDHGARSSARSVTRCRTIPF